MEYDGLWYVVVVQSTLGYNDSGYTDIFFIAIQSHGINYACVPSVNLSG